MDTLAGGNVANRRSIAGGLAARAVKVIKTFIDPFRCPWIHSGRKPTRAAMDAAVDWTASLWAVERCRTARRGAESAVQEQAVADLFRACGLQETSGIRQIQTLDALARGRFTREVILGKAKTDLAVRLQDGRLLAVECKASNSALNRVKRLNRETVGKAENWRTLYGRQVVTAAVLSGVFKVSNLVDAQNAGVFIFWEHDLGPLREFVRTTSRQ